MRETYAFEIQGKLFNLCNKKLNKKCWPYCLAVTHSRICICFYKSIYV